MNIFLRTLAIAICLSTTPALGNQSCDPNPARGRDPVFAKRWVDMLQERNFKALEADFVDRLKRYREGQYSDHTLMIDLNTVSQKGAELEPFFSEWIRTAPQSSIAHLFKGYFHIKSGYIKRGTKYAKDTSPEQFSAMAMEFDLAGKHLNEVLRLDKSLGLAFAGLIDIAKSDAGTLQQFPAVSSVELLNSALLVDPKSMSVRINATHAFNPKWGGSFELLDKLLAVPENATLQPTEKRYLAYIVNMGKADVSRWVDKQHRQAILYANLAHQACPSRDSLWLASESAYDLEDWKSVRELMNQSVSLGRDEPHLFSKRGFAAENMGDMPAALQDYQKAIQLGQGWAMNRVGWFYETGRFLEKDPVKARQLYERAVEKGNPTAKAALVKMSEDSR